MMRSFNSEFSAEAIRVVIEQDSRIAALESRLAESEARCRKLEDKLKRKENCAFIGPMRDCPTHGDSVVLTAAEARAEEYRRDAERYRWLKESQTIYYKPAGYDGCKFGRHDCMWQTDEADLDTAIDAALGKSSTDKGEGE